MAGLGRQLVRFVHVDEQIAPQLLGRIDEGLHERGDPLHTQRLRHLEQVDHGAGTKLQKPVREQHGRAKIRRRVAALTHQHDVELLAQRGEFAFHVDDDLRHVRERLLDHAAESPRFPASTIRLKKQVRSQHEFEIGVERLAGCREPEIDFAFFHTLALLARSNFRARIAAQRIRPSVVESRRLNRS